MVYDSSVGTSAPPAGSAPIGKPRPTPRSHAFHERRQSSAVIQSEPRTASIVSWTPVNRDATYKASPIANRPTASVVIDAPSSSDGRP